MFLSTELKQTYSSVWGYNYTPNATSPYKLYSKDTSAPHITLTIIEKNLEKTEIVPILEVFGTIFIEREI